MSGNTSSPNVSPSRRATVSSDSLPSGQENTGSQRGLQEASVALEVAYSRVRRVRRSLLQLSDAVQHSEDGASRPVAEDNNIGPGHEALLLSGGEREGPTGQEGRPTRILPFESVPLSPTLLVRGATDHRLPAPSRSVASPSRRSATSQLPTPRNPDSAARPPRLRSRRERSPNDMIFLSRDVSSSETASTTRGLRVAAREAQGQESGSEAQARAAEFDSLLARQRERMADSAHALASFWSQQRAERQVRPVRTAESHDTQRTTLPSMLPNRTTFSSTTTPFRPPDPSRWRRSRPGLHAANARQGHVPVDLPDEIDALYSDPNRPLSSSSGPPRPWWTAFGPTRSVDANLEMSFPLDDTSSDINIDWSDDEFISWLFPTQDSAYPQSSRDPPSRRPTDRPANGETIRVTRTTDTTVSPPENSPPRRGWARLDADGNEIPPNEEAELERSRTEYRLRALQQNRQAGSAGGLFQSTGPRTMYGSVLDSALHVPEGRYRPAIPHIGESTRLYVDPLPMPLAVMVEDFDTPRYTGLGADVIVPQHACLAGR